MPSARQALLKLNDKVKEHMRDPDKENDVDDIGLTWIYALAEADVLLRMINTLDDLLTVSRQLFGTASWYGSARQSAVDTTLVMSMQENTGTMY